jgi:hypothetical protein
MSTFLGLFLKVEEKIDSLLKKETMFTSFENCEKELDSMKENGTYVELKTPEGELAAENGLPSKYKDYPILYGVLKTPTFKKIIGDASNNLVVYEDTKEPMIVYHSTPIDIPLNEGLKPHIRRGGAPNVLGKKDSLLMSLRRKFKLFPMVNLQLYFAQDANSTKTKAAASTRERNDPHKIYPCFIKLSKPYIMDHPDESKYTWDSSDGTINLKSGDFSVKSEKQIMHIPFNFVGTYTPEEIHGDPRASV